MGMNQMDLKQQLVIWKRANYLLDHIYLTPKLCDRLLEDRLLSADAMDIVQAQSTETERILKLLTVLGQPLRNDSSNVEHLNTNNNDVRESCVEAGSYFETFLKVLTECNCVDAAKELRRTERNTKFGEILPPVFTYFMDTSQFLKQYSHIAVRLGEEEKYLLQTFIDGKLDMITRILNDKHAYALNECQRLNEVVQRMTSLLEEEERRGRELQGALNDQLESNRKLKEEIIALELELESSKDDRRIGIYFRTEMEKLQQLLSTECIKYDLNVNDFSTVHIPNSNGLQHSVEAVRLRLLMPQVQLAASRLHSERILLSEILAEQERIKLALGSRDSKSNQARYRGLQATWVESNACTRKLREDISQLEQRMDDYHVEIKTIVKKLKGLENRSSPSEATENTLVDWDKLAEDKYSPVVHLKQLLEAIQEDHEQRLRKKDEERDRQREEYDERLEEQASAHLEDTRQMKARLKGKMLEVHRREMTLRKLRKQMGVISRLHSVNVSLTKLTPEDCKRIVRAVIRETRILQEIFEDKDPPPQHSLTPSNQHPTPAPGGHRSEINPSQASVRQRQTVKKPKKKRKYVALADDRLMYVADKLKQSWRTLGAKLDLTSNRMDLIELDAPYGREPQQLGFAMLRLWRDEEGGISIDIVKALREMNRDDLASVLIPESRIEIIPSTQTQSASLSVQKSSDNDGLLSLKPPQTDKQSDEKENNQATRGGRPTNQNNSSMEQISRPTVKVSQDFSGVFQQQISRNFTDAANRRTNLNQSSSQRSSYVDSATAGLPSIIGEVRDGSRLANRSDENEGTNQTQTSGLWVGKPVGSPTRKTGAGIRRPIYAKLRAPKLPRVQ